MEGTAFQGVSVFVIPRNILAPPRGWPPLCFTRQNATNPVLGEKPVAGFVVKWAILDSNQ